MNITPETLQVFGGRLHVVVVHVPIGLLLVAALLELARALFGGGLANARRTTFSGTATVIGALGAVVAAALGWIGEAAEPLGASVETTVDLHRWLGVGGAALAIIAMIAVLCDRDEEGGRARLVFRFTLITSALAIGAAGHFGGSLVHGGDHLLAPLRAPAPEPEIPAELRAPEPDEGAGSTAEPQVVAVTFTDVEPIIIDYCARCHGPKRQKGGLRADTMAHLFAGEPSEWTIVPGDPDASEFIRRIELPPDDLDFMPEGEDPLPADDIALLREWIALGAVAGAVGASDETGEEPVVDVEPAVEPEADDAEPAIDPQIVDAALDRLRDTGAHATRVAQASLDTDVDFTLASDPVTDASLELLRGLEPSLTALRLGGSAVTDAGLAQLAPFTRLTRISLERTGVGDAGARTLATLPNLTIINLYQTSLTDAGLMALADIPALERVFVWRTNVTDEGTAAFAERRPDVEVIRGAVTLPVPSTDEGA